MSEPEKKKIKIGDITALIFIIDNDMDGAEPEIYGVRGELNDKQRSILQNSHMCSDFKTSEAHYIIFGAQDGYDINKYEHLADDRLAVKCLELVDSDIGMDSDEWPLQKVYTYVFYA